jgi:putative ABC transport system substrate-binding protein
LSLAQASKTYRIGYLVMSDEATIRPYKDALLAGLAEQGFVVGRNVDFQLRYAHGDKSRLPALADELLALKPDLLLGTEDTASALRERTQTIPIVFPAFSDPVKAGLVHSLSRPGTNATGLSYYWDELVAKHVELLTEIVPKMKLLGFIGDANFPTEARFEDIVQKAAKARGAGVLIHAVRNADDLKPGIEALKKGGAQGLVVLATASLFRLYGEIGAQANRLRLPSISGFAAFANGGGLASYGPDLIEQFRYTATFVAKILKGAKPADLPVEQSRTFEFVINLKTARAIGLPVPQSLLVRANRVIE